MGNKLTVLQAALPCHLPHGLFPALPLPTTLPHQLLHLPHGLDGTGLGRHALDGAQRHAQCLQRELAERAELFHVRGQEPASVSRAKAHREVGY